MTTHRESVQKRREPGPCVSVVNKAVGAGPQHQGQGQDDDEEENKDFDERGKVFEPCKDLVRHGKYDESDENEDCD